MQPHNVEVSRRRHRRARRCLPAIVRMLFLRGKSRKVGTDKSAGGVDALQCQDIPEEREKFEQKEPSEWHLPTDWAIDVKEPPKVITKGANMRLATDFFSLRPIRKISSNISAGLRSKARNSSSQGGRSSVSGHRISVRSRAASQQENISEIVDLDGSVDRKCSLSRGVSTRFSPPSFLGSFLSAKVGSSETPVVDTKVSNISIKSVKSMSPTITVDKENSSAETLKQENAEVVEKIITEEPEVSVGTEIKT